VTNGALDPSFDGDGAAMLDSAGDETATALALRPDGKIVVAGNAITSATALDIVVYRLKADGGPGPVNGALDPAFDRDGAAGVDTGAGETAAAMELRPDGSVVVAGSARSGSNEHAIIAQLRPDGGDGGVNGALDASFDRDGVAGISGAGRDGLRAIALQPDGKIVVAGHTSTAPGASPDGVVYRLNARGGPGALNGALDATFGNDGRLVFETTDEDDEIQAVELQPDGRILAAGWRAIKGSRAVVYRLAPDGRALASGGLDPSFGAGGIATFPASSAFDVVHGLALAPDGGIVAGGFAYLSPRVRQPIVGRLLGDAAPQPAGTPDQPGPSVGQPTGDVVTAAFGARTRVTLRVGKRSKTGRVKVRVVNANGFMVRGKLAAKGAKTRSFRVPARTTRTITLRLPRRRGRARVAATVVDPAGNSRVVRALAR
jgi:uncharacterized delta-60 repeat protein